MFIIYHLTVYWTDVCGLQSENYATLSNAKRKIVRKKENSRSKFFRETFPMKNRVKLKRSSREYPVELMIIFF
jgi:hypothetical protein